LSDSSTQLFPRCADGFFLRLSRAKRRTHGWAVAGSNSPRNTCDGNRCKILYRNFRAPRGGEVDIVCRDRSCNTLVFVEVKTRRTRDFGDPSSAVNLSKQRLIARGALAWLRMLDNPDVRFRFDIVEVVITDGTVSCNLIQNAFQLPDEYIW
jgi:putative endonuclease